MNGADRHDESMLDAVAVYALGALPDAEARAVRAHIDACATCAEEYRALRPAADFVGYAADVRESAPTQLQSARMKNAIMREVRGVKPAPASPDEAPATAKTLPERPRMPWVAYLATAASLAVAFLATYQLNDARAGREQDEKQIAALQARVDTQQRAIADAQSKASADRVAIADLAAPGAERYAVGNGVVARANDRIVIALQHVPALPKGKVYQAWTLRRGAKTMTPSVTFSPDASGTAIVALPGTASDLTIVALSVEPEGGSKAPTTKPVFVRPLS
jgi:hypothetical protein